MRGEVRGNSRPLPLPSASPSPSKAKLRIATDRDGERYYEGWFLSGGAIILFEVGEVDFRSKNQEPRLIAHQRCSLFIEIPFNYIARRRRRLTRSQEADIMERSRMLRSRYTLRANGEAPKRYLRKNLSGLSKAFYIGYWAYA